MSGATGSDERNILFGVPEPVAQRSRECKRSVHVSSSIATSDHPVNEPCDDARARHY